MIVCHCNVLTCKNVREAIDSASGQDGLSLVTPGLVFKKNATRPRCGNCMPEIHRLIEDHLAYVEECESRARLRKLGEP